MPHLATAGDNSAAASPCARTVAAIAVPKLWADKRDQRVCVVNVVAAFAFDDTAAATVLLIFARR